ncbi:MAG: RHS repeat-associated core domain-containing protein [Pseudomonadota bacterium]
MNSPLKALRFTLATICALVVVWSGHLYASTFDSASHEIVVGDYNSDGHADLYLRPRVQTVVIRGPLAFPITATDLYPPIVLLSNSGVPGSFTILNSPSQSTLDSVSWSTADYDSVIQDIDGDGLADMLVQSTTTNDDYVLVLGQSDSSGVIWNDSYTPPGTSSGTQNNGITALPTIVSADLYGVMNYQAGVGANGAASVVMPIEVLPGITPETTPNLAISYAGQLGPIWVDTAESTIGEGWRLSGLSTLRRCVTGSTTLSTLQFTSADFLCLDGQRLKLVSGSYWANNSEYRTERESFLKIVAKGTGASQWFEVHAPDGSVLRYGKEATSRVRIGGSTTALYEWGLSEVEDSFGNKLYVNYYKNDSRGELYPRRIDYGSYSVTFEYATRATPYPKASFGSSLFAERSVYLHTIKTASSVASREYRLKYAVVGSGPNTRNRLVELQACGYSGSVPKCLGKMTFSYTADITPVLWRLLRVTDNLGAFTEYTTSTDLPLVSGVTLPAQVTDAASCTDAHAYNWSTDGHWGWFVSEMKKSNGMNNSTSHWYYKKLSSGAVSDAQRGFLGFEGRQIQEPGGRYSRVWQHVCFPYTGLPAGEYVYDNDPAASGNLLTRTDRRVAKLDFHSSKTALPFEQQRITLNYDVASTGTGTTQFGAERVTTDLSMNANLLTERTQTREVANTGSVSGVTFSLSAIQLKEETTTTFANNTANWTLNFAGSASTTYEANGVSGQTQTVIASHLAGSTSRPTLVKSHPGADVELRQWRFYDAGGNLAVTLAEGDGVVPRLDSINNRLDNRFPTSVTNAEGHTTLYGYDLRHGKPNEITDPNSQVTTITYDPLGRITEIDYPDARLTTYSYSNASSGTIHAQDTAYKVVIDNNWAPDVEVYFDTLGRQIRQKTKALHSNSSIEWIFVDTVYDGVGWLDKRSLPYNVLGDAHFYDYAYDKKNRVQQLEAPGGAVHNYNYVIESGKLQQQHLLTTSLPAEYLYTTRDYDARGWLVTVIDGMTKSSPTGAAITTNQARTTYSYWPNGWLKTVKVGEISTPMTTVASLTYDVAGNRTAITEANTGTTHFVFNAFGELVEQTDALDRTIYSAYDRLGRQVSRNDNGRLNLWLYDPANAKGQLASRKIFSPSTVTPDFVETYTYDSLSRLTDIQTNIEYAYGNAEFELERTYDSYSRVYDTTYPSGLTVRQGYSATGHANQVSSTVSPFTTWHKIVDMSPFGRPAKVELGNGRNWNFSFDAYSGEVTGITQSSLPNKANLPDLAFTWRDHGQLRTRSRGATIETFSYDGQNRLIGADVTGRELDYSYDAMGNLLSLTSSISVEASATAMNYGSSFGDGNAGPHGLATGTYDDADYTFKYDAVGNVYQISSTSQTATQTTTMTYDAQNRALSIKRPGVTDLAFAYDPDGLRYYKHRSLGDEHTFYLYGGAYQEIRIGSASTGYRKTQINDAVQHTKDPSDGETYLYFRRDHLGSIDGVMDKYGVIVDELGYEPYGSRRKEDWLAEIGSADLNEILNNERYRTKRGFTDHEHLDRVDVIHMNGRIYDPRFGRFLNADPIVQYPDSSQSYNRYSYGRGSPLSYTDPSGFAEKKVTEVMTVYGVREGHSYIDQSLVDNFSNTFSAEYSFEYGIGTDNVTGLPEVTVIATKGNAGNLLANPAKYYAGLAGIGFGGGAAIVCAATAGAGCLGGLAVVAVFGVNTAIDGATGRNYLEIGLARAVSEEYAGKAVLSAEVLLTGPAGVVKALGIRGLLLGRPRSVYELLEDSLVRSSLISTTVAAGEE